MIRVPASLLEVSYWPPILLITAIVSGLFALLALAMTLHGLRSGSSRTFCILWAVAAVLAAVLCYLTVTGNLIRIV